MEENREDAKRQIVSAPIADFLGVPVIRSVPPSAVGRVLRTPRGNRAPSNVPPLVDNLWEWARPPAFPSRRSSAFGSPTAEQALSSGPYFGVPCLVWVKPEFKLAQLPDCPDARNHRDVAALMEKFTLRHTPVASSALSALQEPLASQSAVESALRVLGSGVARTILKAITLWRDCLLWDNCPPSTYDPIGEFFFEAPSGYVLVPLDSESSFVRAY